MQEIFFEDFLLPLAICVILPLGIVITSFVTRYKDRKNRYKVLSAAIEKGVQLPENFFEETCRKPKPARTRKPTSMLIWGIVLVMIGLGGIATAAIEGAGKLTATGIIPTFIGLGLIAGFYVQRYYSKKDAE